MLLSNFLFWRYLNFIPLWAKWVEEFIEIRHKKNFPTRILNTLGCLWLCNSVANKLLSCIFQISPKWNYYMSVYLFDYSVSHFIAPKFKIILQVSSICLFRLKPTYMMYIINLSNVLSINRVSKNRHTMPLSY